MHTHTRARLWSNLLVSPFRCSHCDSSHTCWCFLLTVASSSENKCNWSLPPFHPVMGADCKRVYQMIQAQIHMKVWATVCEDLIRRPTGETPAWGVLWKRCGYFCRFNDLNLWQYQMADSHRRLNIYNTAVIWQGVGADWDKGCCVRNHGQVENLQNFKDIFMSEMKIKTFLNNPPTPVARSVNKHSNIAVTNILLYACISK